MGNKDESTNLIGRKGSKMTMKSNVKTLALKVYDEQIPDGWDKLKERIKELKKDEYQCLGIKHDEDVLGDDFFEPSTEKPHYHILIRVMRDSQNVTKSGKHVSTILNDLGIVFRKEDATMITNHGIETVGDFGAYATYLTHDTEKAINDGKQHYDMSAIVSNMSSEEILKIREGYVRVSDKMKKVTSGEIVEVDEFCYELGRQFGDFDDWYYNQRIFLRSNARMKHCKEKYNKGIQDSIDAESFINRLCIFITGKGNTGKSYTSKMTLIEMGYKRIVSVDNCGTGKFDKVTPTTQAIIINDQTAPALLNLCDNAPTLVYHRGSGDQYFTGNIVIVTSNLSFEEWAKECGQSLKQIQPYWHGMEIHVDEVHGYYDRNKHEQCMSLEHAHGVATPFVEGKGVNAKGFMTKANLSRATQVIDEMCLKEFGISYRTYADPQHKSIEELKSETNIARNEMQKVIDTQNKVIDTNRDTILKQTDKMAENQMEIMEQDEIIQDMRSENRSLQTANENLKMENESLRTALDSKTKDFETAKSKCSQYFNEMKKLKSNISKLLKSQEIELGNLSNLTKSNADWQNYIADEQNRIENARDYLELDNADDFDFER